jgi:hypothetical protein
MAVVYIKMTVVERCSRVRASGTKISKLDILVHNVRYSSARQHTSAYVSIRQHTSAYVSIRQHNVRYSSVVLAVVSSVPSAATSNVMLTYADVC